MLQDLFRISGHDHVLAGLGVALLLAFWLPRLIVAHAPSPSAPLMILGLVVVGLVPGMPKLDPTQAPAAWELASEIVVIIVLFATGLKIDRIWRLRLWVPTIRLLAIAMPLTVAAVAIFGWAVAGFSIGAAVLLGASMSPTDPVLAGDVEVGPPLEGGEHPVRFALTTEAGLNDGLAFPFVHLGILIATQGPAPSEWLAEWIVRDLFYRIAIGAAFGVATGWILGKIMFEVPRSNRLAQSGPGAVALAAVLVAYGTAELVQGYGFISAFVAGLTCRRTEKRHEFNRQLHDFSDALVHAMMAVLLVALGASLPVLWPHLTWQQAAVGLLLLIAIRPIAAWISLLGTDLRGHDRGVVSFFGVRGIGSVFYLGFALGQVKLENEAALWATAVFTILASTILHGLSARPVVDRLTRSRRE